MSASRAVAVTAPVSTGKLTTVREILEKTTAYFTGKGISTARLDSEVLLAHVLGCDRLRLYLNLDRPLDERELASARDAVRRRAAREPVAYITGKKEFAGRDFQVGPGVLIPRPDTEILVEEVLREIHARWPDVEEPVNVLEFGVGSGAIAVTLAAEDPRVEVTATEINEDASAAARRNAEQHGVGDRMQVLLTPDLSGLNERYHALVSNPPYIDPAELPDLAPDVARYEPHEALFAEEQGLKWYRYLAREAERLLIPGGLVAVEIGYRQRSAVEEIFTETGLTGVRGLKDFAGNDRIVIGTCS